MKLLRIVFACSLLAFICACAEREERQIRSGPESPEELVRRIFDLRLNEGNFGAASFGLQRVEPYAAGDLQSKIRTFLAAEKQINRMFRGMDVASFAYSEYLRCTSLDPLTACGSPPHSATMSVKEKRADSATVLVDYKLQGTARKYRRRIVVTLAYDGGRWKILDVKFADNPLPVLGERQSAMGFLTFLIDRMEKSLKEVQKDPEKLSPPSPSARQRGLFDSD